MKSIYDLIWTAAERTPQQLALVDDRTPRALSYSELIAQVERMAAGFHASGIHRADRVALALPNVFELCLAIIALQRLGATPAPMNFRLPTRQIADLVARGKMQGAVIESDPTLAAAVAGALPASGALFCLGDAHGTARSLLNCIGDVSTLPAPPALRPDEETLIFYTSGTTGSPKAVRITHAADDRRITWVSPVIGLRCGAELRTLGLAPLYHAIGCHGSFLATLALNGTYYVMSAFDPAKAVDMIERREITYLFAVPTVFQALMSAPNYAPRKFRSLRHVVSGGATPSPRLIERMCSEWPGEVTNAYGSTEANFVLYARTPAPGHHRVLRPGFPARTRVICFGGTPEDVCPPGQPGEMIIDANVAGVFSGYLDNPLATAAKLRNGWYYTGDACIAREDGQVELIGRTDDMIRSGGESIYPEEVEAVLAGHPGVAEVCVTGIPNEFWGQAVVACVVRKDPRLTHRELDELCVDSELAGFKRPKAYFFVSDLPKNQSNKVQRSAVCAHILSATDGRLHYIAA